MEIWNALKKVNNKKTLKAISTSLRHIAMEGAGRNCGGILSAESRAGDNFRPEGIAFYRDICLSHANSIIHNASVQQTFIPPSPETLAWGGFLGGEVVTYNDESLQDAAIKLVLDVITNKALA